MTSGRELTRVQRGRLLAVRGVAFALELFAAAVGVVVLVLGHVIWAVLMIFVALYARRLERRARRRAGP